MESPARDSFRTPRPVMLLACVAALFALGFALSARPPQASAGGLLPTVTLPGVTTVTLPAVGTPTVPASTTTVALTTTSPGPPDSSMSVATTPASTTRGTTAQVAGAKRLQSGAISIPISSVRAPARLRLAVTFVPGRVASVHAQVIDTRGYRVRGARVRMQSTPGRTLVAAKAKLSAADGRVSFPVRLRRTTRVHTVTLTIRAFDPAAPALANASSSLRLTIRARG